MSSLGKEVVFWFKAAVVAAVLAFLPYYFDLLARLPAADARTGASVLSQLSGTMLGFVLAALAVLTALGNAPLIVNMHLTGHFGVLLKRMLGSIAAFGIVTIAGAALLFVPTIELRYIYPLIGAALFAAILLADVCRKLWLVLDHLH